MGYCRLMQIWVILFLLAMVILWHIFVVWWKLGPFPMEGPLIHIWGMEVEVMNGDLFG